MTTTKVGIGVVLMKGTEILLGKRQGSHGEGEWGLPGGGMEHLESFDATARRELAEEIGPQVKFRKPVVISVINLVEYAPKHYIDIGMYAEWLEGDPIIMEPEKCSEWRWFDIRTATVYDLAEQLPSPRFATVDRILESMFDRVALLSGLVTVHDVV